MKSPKLSTTLADVAQLSGISKSTVSRVLNDNAHVSESARQAVLNAVATLDYQQNHAARALRTRVSFTVGLVVGSLRNEVFAAVAQGMDRVLSDTQRTLVVATTNGDEERERRVISALLKRGVDGLVISTTRDDSPNFQQLRTSGIPVVILDRKTSDAHFDRILTDHRSGLRDAVADLREKGHRRIALLLPPSNTRPGVETAKVFRKEVPDCGDLILASHLTEGFGVEATEKLLQMRQPPTAMIVSGTQVLIGVLTDLNERGISIPEGMSLIAYDESDAARVHSPSISVIRRDRELMGELAAELLLERLEAERGVAKEVIVSTDYLRRGSVSVPNNLL